MCHQMRRLCEGKIQFSEGPSGHPPQISVILRLEGDLPPERDMRYPGKECRDQRASGQCSVYFMSRIYSLIVFSSGRRLQIIRLQPEDHFTIADQFGG